MNYLEDSPESEYSTDIKGKEALMQRVEGGRQYKHNFSCSSSEVQALLFMDESVADLPLLYLGMSAYTLVYSHQGDILKNSLVGAPLAWVKVDNLLDEMEGTYSRAGYIVYNDSLMNNLLTTHSKYFSDIADNDIQSYLKKILGDDAEKIRNQSDIDLEIRRGLLFCYPLEDIIAFAHHSILWTIFRRKLKDLPVENSGNEVAKKYLENFRSNSSVPFSTIVSPSEKVIFFSLMRELIGEIKKDQLDFLFNAFWVRCGLNKNFCSISLDRTNQYKKDFYIAFCLSGLDKFLLSERRNYHNMGDEGIDRLYLPFL